MPLDGMQKFFASARFSENPAGQVDARNFRFALFGQIEITPAIFTDLQVSPTHEDQHKGARHLDVTAGADLVADGGQAFLPWASRRS